MLWSKTHVAKKRYKKQFLSKIVLKDKIEYGFCGLKFLNLQKYFIVWKQVPATCSEPPWQKDTRVK